MLYIQEIFEKQEVTTKFYGLADSESTQEFDQKFEGLKNDWNNRKSGIVNISFLIGFNKKRLASFRYGLMFSNAFCLCHHSIVSKYHMSANGTK